MTAVQNRNGEVGHSSHVSGVEGAQPKRADSHPVSEPTSVDRGGSRVVASNRYKRLQEIGCQRCTRHR